MDKQTARKNIRKYIEKGGYAYTAWSVNDLLIEYKNYYLKDRYVSHTAEDCFINLKEEFKVLANG